jgi:hypothetical protein
MLDFVAFSYAGLLRAALPPIVEWRAKRAGHFGGKRFGERCE